MVLFRWYDANTSLVALDMMTKTWNFVAKKIAVGVNKFLSFFCLILIWCVCMIFSKVSLVTSHGAFSTRLDFTAGNTPCRKINQSTTSIHSVSNVLVFRTAQVENTRLKCSGDLSLGNECKNKLQTHTQESLCHTYFRCDPISYIKNGARNSIFLHPVKEEEVSNILKDKKIAKVIPLFQGGESKYLINYRPVSVLPVFSNVLEKLMYDRIMAFVNRKRYYI